MLWNDRFEFLEKIKEKKRFGIFLDMGVGKTALLLALIDYKFTKDVKKVLIITPKQVSLSTWQDEIKKWDNFSYLEDMVTLIKGDAEQRNETLKNTSEYCIHIISSSLTEWLYGKRIRKGKRAIIGLNKLTPDYDLIIVDECSQFKSTSTKRYKALKKLAKKDLFLLSGTPFSNIKKYKNEYFKADEIYYIFSLLRIYDGSLTSFRNDFCYTKKWDEFNYRMSSEMYEIITGALDGYCIRKKLTLDVERKEHKVYCEIDRLLLKKITEDYFIETNNGAEITASNKAIMINKALQLSNGFMYNSSGKVERFNSYKFERLNDLLATINDNVVIYYNFVEDKEYLLKNLPNSHLFEGEEDIKKWNAGEIKILILSPFSAKYGLNLQEGGHTVIWYGLVWSAETYEQANARLYRTGQEKDVDIFYLLSDSGYEEYVYRSLITKTMVIDNFISYIK